MTLAEYQQTFVKAAKLVIYLSWREIPADKRKSQRAATQVLRFINLKGTVLFVMKQTTFRILPLFWKPRG